MRPPPGVEVWCVDGSSAMPRSSRPPRRGVGTESGERLGVGLGLEECLLPIGVLDILSVLRSTRRPHLTRWVMAIERPLRRTSALSPQLGDASPPPALHRTPLRTDA